MPNVEIALTPLPRLSLGLSTEAIESGDSIFDAASLAPADINQMSALTLTGVTVTLSCDARSRRRGKIHLNSVLGLVLSRSLSRVQTALAAGKHAATDRHVE